MSRLIFQLHLTNRCNKRCKHCYQEEYNGEELSLEDVFSTINQYKELLFKYNETQEVKEKGQINITGGEPFVRKDIWQIIEKLANEKEYFTFGILTNGSLIDDEAGEKLAMYKPRMVQISLDGKKKTHDFLRGKGSYNEVIESLKTLNKYGIYSMVSFTANNLNYKEFKDVVKAGVKGKAKKVWTDRLVEYSKNSEVKTLEPEETVKYINLIKREQEKAKGKIKVSGERALQFLSGDNPIYRCSAGDGLIVMLPNGDVMPCRRLPLIGGNIKENTLSEIYFNSEIFKDLREEKVLEGCEKCSFKHSCMGGAKCITFGKIGTYKKGDIGCILCNRDERLI